MKFYKKQTGLYRIRFAKGGKYFALIFNNKKKTLISSEDIDLLAKYSIGISKIDYAICFKRGATKKDSTCGNLHAVIAERHLGKRKKGMVIDHINRIRYDNRKENLRYITHSENISNTDIKKWRKNNKYTYIYFSKQSHCFYIEVKTKGKKIIKKGFQTPEQALSYLLKNKEYFFKKDICRINNHKTSLERFPCALDET